MGKFDLWNKNTKKWANKYGKDIIKKYPKRVDVDWFEISISLDKVFSPDTVFRCWAACPAFNNENGDILILQNKKVSWETYCLLGEEVESFLEKFQKKIMKPASELMGEYHNVEQQRKKKKWKKNK